MWGPWGVSVVCGGSGEVDGRGKCGGHGVCVLCVERQGGGW